MTVSAPCGEAWNAVRQLRDRVAPLQASPYHRFLPFHQIYLWTTEALCQSRRRLRNPELFARFLTQFVSLYLTALDAHLDRRPVPEPWADYFERPSTAPLVQFLRGARIHIHVDLRHLLQQYSQFPREDFDLVACVTWVLLGRFTKELRRSGSTAARLAGCVPFLSRWGHDLVNSWRLTVYRKVMARAGAEHPVQFARPLSA